LLIDGLKPAQFGQPPREPSVIVLALLNEQFRIRLERKLNCRFETKLRAGMDDCNRQVKKGGIMRMRVAMIISFLIWPLGWNVRLSEIASYLWPAARNGSQYTRLPSEQFHWQEKIAADRVVEIHGLNGDIYAEPSTEGRVEVTAVKHRPPGLAGEIEIRVAKREDGVSIRATTPGQSGEGPHGSGRAMDQQATQDSIGVDFMVRVPWGVRLIAHAVDGDIVATSLGSPVEAEAVNGNVRLSTSAYGQARVVNGSITASLGTTRGKQSLTFETRHGDILLHLPPVSDSEITVKRLGGGEISSQFPLKRNCALSKPELKISTFEGRIGLYRHGQYMALLEELGWALVGKDQATTSRESEPPALRTGICGLRFGQAGSVALAP
jgi:hypothetical protein